MSKAAKRMGVGAMGVAGLLLLAPIVPLLAAEPAPLTISADRLDMDGLKQTAQFDGHVDASEGEMRLQADRMSVRYATERDAAGKERTVVREVHAEGNVRLDQGLYKGRGDKAVFNTQTRSLQLMGGKVPAVVEKGKDRLEGAALLLVLTQDRRVEKVTAQGGSGRVSARFTPSDEGKAP